MAAAIDLVEDFKEALLEVWQRDGKTTWPIDLNSITHLFAGDFDRALLEDLRALERAGLTRGEIGRLFVIPQRIVRLAMPFVQGLGALGLSREQRAGHVRYLLSLADELKYGDPSNRDGRNILLSPQQCDAVTEASRLAPADVHGSRLVHRLCGILWAYAETLFFKTHGFVREFHGPYRRSGEEDRRFLVRDFVCLNPVELWDECEGLGYSKIRVVAAYDRLDMSVDIYNHVTIPEGASFVDSLRAYYVECDGRFLGAEEMESLSRDLSAVMTAVCLRVEAMRREARAEKYAEIFWFSKKPLSDRLGEDWRVPEAVRSRIREGEPKPERKPMRDDALRVMLKLAF